MDTPKTEYNDGCSPVEPLHGNCRGDTRPRSTHPPTPIATPTPKRTSTPLTCGAYRTPQSQNPALTQLPESIIELEDPIPAPARPAYTPIQRLPRRTILSSAFVDISVYLLNALCHFELPQKNNKETQEARRIKDVKAIKK